MTPEQRQALEALCGRYNVPFDEDNFYTGGVGGLPEGYYTGKVGPIVVGVSPAGHISS